MGPSAAGIDAPPSQLGAEISMGNNAPATTSEVINLANWNGKESTSGTIRALSDSDVVDPIIFGHQSTSQRHRPLQITYKPRVTSESIMTLCLEMVGLLIPVRSARGRPLDIDGHFSGHRWVQRLGDLIKSRFFRIAHRHTAETKEPALVRSIRRALADRLKP